MVGSRPTRLAGLSSTIGLWLWIGFSGGAGVLLLIAAPLEDSLTGRGVSQGAVNIILSSLALLWVLLSLILSILVERWLASSSRPWRKRLIAHLAGLVVSAFVFHIFLTAGAGAFGAFRGGREEVTERFVFGPYPDEEEVARIADQGFEGIVSLLSPLVPFEAVLLERERAAAGANGLELIEAHMLPWVSSNEESLGLIRDLARSDSGPFYVHCYLGRHRVDLARYVVLEEAGLEAPPPSQDLLSELERGEIVTVSDTIAAGPLPARDEWFEFVVRSGTRRVISLLDPENPEDLPWIEDESRWAEASGIEIILVPVRSEEDIDAVLDEIRASQSRTYIHGFLSQDRDPRLRMLLSRLIS